MGSGHRGAVGRVAASANGFDPTAILRDFDEGTVTNGVREWEIVAEDREIEVAPGVRYAAWTYNGRVRDPRCGSGGRAASRAVHQRVEPPAHDALPRHPPAT